MSHTAEMIIGPVAMLALQRLANTSWQPTELMPRVRLIPRARIVWKGEAYPFFRTVEFVGRNGVYTIKLPRRIHHGETAKSLAVCPVALHIDPTDMYDEVELVQFLEALTTRSTKQI